MAKQKRNKLKKKNYGFEKSKKIIILFFAFSLTLLVISFYLDNAAFKFMELIKNPVFDAVALFINTSIFVFIILAILTLIFIFERKKHMVPWLWLSFFVSILISNIMKFALMRPRPGMIEYLYPFTQVNDYSFPSGHAATAFSFVPLLNQSFVKYRWLWILSAVLVALSRVYLGVHRLSDVVGGAIVGMVIGEIILYIIYIKRMKSPHANE